MKLDNNGNFIWAKQVIQTTGSPVGAVMCNVIRIDSFGFIYLFGAFTVPGDFDPGPSTYILTPQHVGLYISKLDPSGNFVWAVNANSTSACWPTSGVIKNDKVYISGIFYDTLRFNTGAGIYALVSHGSYDGFIATLDFSGFFKSIFQYGSPREETISSINIDASGNIFTAGQFKDTIDFDPCEGVYNLSALPVGAANSFIVKLNPPINIAVNIFASSTTVTAGQSVTVTSTITNGGTNPTYQWQDSTNGHTWQNINGGTSTSINYIPGQTGDRIRCLLTSNVICAVPSIPAVSNVLVFTVNTVTATNSIPSSSYGIRYFPNPVKFTIHIDSLKLSDKWETLEVISLDGKPIIPIMRIINRTSISINVSHFSSGTYTIILRRKKGMAAYLKFIKL